MKQLSNIRYPKNLITTELLTQKIVSTENKKVIDENNNEILEKLKTTFFQISGAFPYLFDGIAMLCNENPIINGKPIITKIENSLFYHATLSWEDFLRFSLGNYKKGTKQTLLHELYKIQKSPPVKVISIGNINIRTSPISITLYQDNSQNIPEQLKKQWQKKTKKEKTAEISNFTRGIFDGSLSESDASEEILQNEKIQKAFKLKKMLDALSISKDYDTTELSSELLDVLTNKSEELSVGFANNVDTDEEKIEGGKIIGIEISFFGPLFESAIKEIGGAWIQMGINFQAKLETAISMYKTDSRFLAYSKLKRYPTVYRKYTLYLAEHDNGQGDFVTLQAIDMLLHIDPQQLDSKNLIRNIKDTKILVDKANLLLNSMAKDGLLQGVKFTPIKCVFNSSEKVFVISISRNSNKSEIPEYESLFTSDELDEMKNSVVNTTTNNGF